MLVRHNRKRGFAIGAVVLVLSCAAVFGIVSGTRFSDETAEDFTGFSLEDRFVSEDSSEELPKYVYVTGAVKQEGVYRFYGTIRVFEAIELAGGLSENADAARLNQADTVYDGMHLCIPAVGETLSEVYVSVQSSAVNLNTASLEELMTLRGIGKSKAQAILDYRKKHGPFRSVDDLKNVSGIGDSVLDGIRDRVRV